LEINMLVFQYIVPICVVLIMVIQILRDKEMSTNDKILLLCGIILTLIAQIVYIFFIKE